MRVLIIQLIFIGFTINVAAQAEIQPVKNKGVVDIQNSCNSGKVASCYQLGQMHLKGRGVEQDNNEAVRYFTIACNGDDMLACSDLGIMYAIGYGVPEKDDKIAASLFKRACDSRVKGTACDNLAVMYETGRGIEQDYKKAIQLYELGCANDNDLNCYNLGRMYEKGVAVEQSNSEAAKYYSKACALENQDGCDVYDRLSAID